MTLSRRRFLALAGGIFAALPGPAFLRAAPPEMIGMRGTVRGEHVWFVPRGLAVAPGTTIRFVNHDPGNSHTATAYHPDIYGRARRIPKAATPWDSGFLLPEESFEVTLTAPGVHDYYCIPHEMAGMVGRIVVGAPGDSGWEGPSGDTEDILPEALAALPSVEEILDKGRIGEENEG